MSVEIEAGGFFPSALSDQDLVDLMAYGGYVPSTGEARLVEGVGSILEHTEDD